MNNAETIVNNPVTTVNQIYEAFGKGDIPAILELLADDVQWDPWENNYGQKAGVPWLEARKGKTGVVEFFQLLQDWQFNTFKVLSVMGNEHQVAVEIFADIDMPATGGRLQEEEIHLWTFNEEGKVIRFRHYVDTAKHIAVAKGENSAV